MLVLKGRDMVIVDIYKPRIHQSTQLLPDNFPDPTLANVATGDEHFPSKHFFHLFLWLTL